jgi:hypothetical protein|tara:strand:- start:728 stop:1372 length:645 start_codon:yes stop_codon:yes gene_type:complete
MLKKSLLFIIIIFLPCLIISKLFYLTVDKYGLFTSGMHNIFNNYTLLLCLLGLSLLLVNTKKVITHLYFFITFLFFYILTLIFIDFILGVIFSNNLDRLWGFDKFPLVVLYFLSIFLGFMLWFNPINNTFKFLSIIIFSSIISFHVALKDIELFTIKSFINFPGGNLLITLWLGVILIVILKIFNKKYIRIISKIYGSWIIVIGIMSAIFSLIY